VWRALGVEAEVLGVGLAIDVVFVADLLLKVVLGGWRYLRSPWFVVDLLCTAPVLSAISVAPVATDSLRVLRFLRALRVLRVLRGLRSLRLLRLVTHQAETVEQRRFDQILTWSTLLYAGVFLGLVQVGRTIVASTPDTSELFLVAGSMLGMLLVLVVARFQIPALWSQQVRSILNIALPAQVTEWLLKHPEAFDRSIRAPATVMFCDLTGFTKAVERLSIDDVKSHLERALGVIVDAHVGMDLIIDKFIGDAVMSFRGGDLVDGSPADHAWRVVRAALDSEQALARLGDPHFQRIKVGGASADDALIGAFGTAKRLSYTILGDRVNLASRLELACGAVGVRNLFCSKTHGLLADRADLVWRRVGRLRLPGRDLPEEAWEAFDAGDAVGWVAQYHAALRAFEERRFMEAASGFGQLLHDGPSARYGALAIELQAQGAPADWEPVLTIRK
jgi:adenylate cyclase